MRKTKTVFGLVLSAACITPLLGAQSGSGMVPVHMVVTAETTKDSGTSANIDQRDVVVKQGKDKLEVTGWIAARGEQAGLQLVILIDETCNSSQLGTHLEEIRSFVNAQPETALVAIAYMRNAGITLVQDFTTDHSKAAQSIRLPLGSLSTQDSPYLSLISLLKGWPQSKVRREVVMITDGIDRLRGYAASPNPYPFNPRVQGGFGQPSFGPPAFGPIAPGPGPVSMPYISPDVDSASQASQKYGVIIHTIYSPGVGRADRNYYEANNGLNSLSKISDETGGEAFFLTAQAAVSFQPYFDRLQSILNNQYFLVFPARAGKKAGLQRIKLSTEVPDVELAAADNVWVPAAAGGDKDKDK